MAVVCAVLAFSVTLGVAQDRKQGSSSAILGVGARAQGMGGAFTALADDATAASWNPAGLAQLTRPEVSAVFDHLDVESDQKYKIIGRGPGLPEGATVRTESVTLHSEGDYSDLNFASATFPFALGSRPLVAQVSYRALSAFPTITEEIRSNIVDENNFDRRIGDESRFAFLFEGRPEGDIDSFSLSLATGFSNFNVGVSLNHIQADYSDRRFFKVGFQPVLLGPYEFGPASEDTYRFEFSETSYDAGVQWKVSNRFFVGAVYHGGFEAEADTENFYLPDETFTFVGDPIRLKSQVEWPTGLAIGVAFKPADRFTVTADYAQTNWSESRISTFAFADVDCDFDTNECFPVPIDDEGFGPAPFPGIFVLRQDDTNSLRFGAEYVFTWSDVLLPVRAGFFTEEQIFNNVDVEGGQPEYDGFSLGAGFVYHRVQFDVAYVKTTGSDFGRPFAFTGELPRGEVTFEFPARSETVSFDRILMSAIFRF